MSFISGCAFTNISVFLPFFCLWILVSDRRPSNMGSSTNAIQAKIDENDSVNYNTNTFQAKIDENAWVVQIKESLAVLQQPEDEEKLCASVFNVPKELLVMKPEAYIPQSVSIGPYHHWKSELYDMERYKLATVRRFRKRINEHADFEAVVVGEFKKQDWKIRSCYHKFIDYKEETLAWLMALDATFLLECLQFYVRHADKSLDGDVRPLGRVLDSSSTSAAHNSILRDLMMLENQLPLFLLQNLLVLQLNSKARADERLRSLLRLVCQELSPFRFNLPEDSKFNRNERGHVLEELYYSIVPSISSRQNPNPSDEEAENQSPDKVDMSIITQSFTLLWKALSFLKSRPIRFLTECYRRVLSLHVLTAFKRLASLHVKSEEEEGEGSSVKFIPPRRDELPIPSVADLYSAGVKFVPTNGDLTTIQFDEKTATLYLPRVKLDRNTEVILRNLVAFELASVAQGEQVFTRYTSFMNGMIDSEEDVKSLRKSGIIFNQLQSDGEVASLWNSLGKCVRFTEVGYLDKVIGDLNKYYHRKWKVVVMEFVNNQIIGSWKILSLVAVVILLVVTCLQAFCSVYDCRKWFNQRNLQG